MKQVTTDTYIEEMQQLLKLSSKKLNPELFRGHTLELRDIEHSLCEYDKYCRVFFNEGRPRSKYDGQN